MQGLCTVRQCSAYTKAVHPSPRFFAGTGSSMLPTAVHHRRPKSPSRKRIPWDISPSSLLDRGGHQTLQGFQGQTNTKMSRRSTLDTARHTKHHDEPQLERPPRGGTAQCAALLTHANGPTLLGTQGRTTRIPPRTLRPVISKTGASPRTAPRGIRHPSRCPSTTPFPSTTPELLHKQELWKAVHVDSGATRATFARPQFPHPSNKHVEAYTLYPTRHVMSYSTGDPSSPLPPRPPVLPCSPPGHHP